MRKATELLARIRTALPVLPERAGFELAWLALGGLIGINYLTYVPNPAVAAILPRWSFLAWAAALIAGGVAGFYGVLRRGYWPLVAERAGLGMHCGAVFTLGVASVYTWDVRGGPFPVFAVVLVGAWIAASLRRIVHINHEIRTMTTVYIERTDPYDDGYDMENDKG